MNPAPGVTLSISSATAMQLCISHIRRSLGILHSSGYAAETSRAERHPSSASKGSFVFVCPHRCAFVQSVCFCTIQWCQIDAHAVSSFGQNATPSRHNKRERQRRCRLLRSLYSFLYSYVSPSARQLSTTFPVHITSPVNTGTINLPEC